MKWRKYLPWIGILIFIYLIWRIGILSILNSIAQADVVLILAAIVLTGVLVFFQTLKWHIIARKQKIEIPLAESVRINLITNFYGFITPSKLGTVIRADYLKKYTKNIGKGISNFVLDKVLDICAVFFLAIVFSLLIGGFEISGLGYLLVLFFALVLGLYIFIDKKRSRLLLRFFYRKLLSEKVKKKAKLTFDSFYEDMPKKRHFIFFFILNILTWIIAYGVTFLVGGALGIELSFYYFLAILPIGTVVSLIPITVNGLGTREATLISLFALFGVGANKVFSMSILSLLITGILPSLIGSFLTFKNKR